MITTALAELAFIDQIMAILNTGPATTEEIVGRVGTVVCACPLCDGKPRPARLNETYQFLRRLARAGRVTGALVPVPGAVCPDCGAHEMMTVCWTRNLEGER